MKMHGFRIAENMVGLRGRHEDFEAAERELVYIPRSRRTIEIDGEEIRFFRTPPKDSRWPTAAQFLKFHLTVIRSGGLVVTYPFSRGVSNEMVQP